MAGTTTYFGISYPTSTDLVKDGAANMQTIATGFDSAVAIPIYNAQTGTTYTFALADVPKTVTASNASSQTYTIPTQVSVTWPANATLNLVNLGAGAVTIAGAVGVTVNNASTAISQYQSAAIVRTAENTWTVIPFAGGASLLSSSSISGTTGSPTITNFTESGVTYRTYAFTGSGTITTTKAGVCEVVIIAGGGGGGSQGTGGRAAGGGGAGGYFSGAFTLPLGASTITIGGGGAAGSTASPGVKSEIASTSYGVMGGGGGIFNDQNGQRGASGGGAGSGDGGTRTGGTAYLSNVGNDGGNSTDGGTAGGGGGAGAAASLKNGGTGKTSTINGTSTERAGGGGGGRPAGSPGTATGGGGAGGTANGTAATVNTGGGGGGSGIGTGGAGGSGIIFIRVLG
jgi:hypothetical protein